jgi:hypothetical protein
MEMWRFVLSSASLCFRRVIDWDEEACRAIPGFTEVVTGGDGDGIQFCKRCLNLTGPHLFIEFDKRS